MMCQNPFIRQVTNIVNALPSNATTITDMCSDSDCATERDEIVVAVEAITDSVVEIQVECEDSWFGSSDDRAEYNDLYSYFTDDHLIKVKTRQFNRQIQLNNLVCHQMK